MTALKGRVSETDSVDQAMHVMRQEGISSVLAELGVEAEWGIMTQRDIVKKIINANRSPALTKVGEIASKPLIRVSPDVALSQVADILAKENIRRVVVMGESGVPEGIVSDNALFRAVEEFGWEPHE